MCSKILGSKRGLAYKTRYFWKGYNFFWSDSQRASHIHSFSDNLSSSRSQLYRSPCLHHMWEATWWQLQKKTQCKSNKGKEISEKCRITVLTRKFCLARSQISHLYWPTYVPTYLTSLTKGIRPPTYKTLLPIKPSLNPPRTIHFPIKLWFHRPKKRVYWLNTLCTGIYSSCLNPVSIFSVIIDWGQIFGMIHN